MGQFNEKEYQIKYREANKEKARAYYKEYRRVNAERIKEDKKEYFQRRKHIAYKRANERWKTDLDYRIKTYLRKRLRAAVKQNIKSGKTIDILGCSVEFFKEYISNKFVNGMTWENYGRYGWHIDHIIPIASFDFSDIEQQKKCFHYTNMQPLWAIDNHKKGART